MLYQAMSTQLGGLGSRRLVAAFLLVLMSHGPTLSQETFVAISPTEASRYHLDFARNFFASPEAEKADRANLYAALKALENFKGKDAGPADSLQRTLQRKDQGEEQFD